MIYTKLTSRLLALAGLLLFSSDMAAQDTNRFVFLCFGQSNMEGFPGIEEQDKGPVDERFQVLAAVDFPKQGRTKGNWYPAVPPSCRWEIGNQRSPKIVISLPQATASWEPDTRRHLFHCWVTETPKLSEDLLDKDLKNTTPHENETVSSYACFHSGGPALPGPD